MRPAFAVLRSDYTSSAIGLLAADGSVIDHDWVDSGTRVASLTTSLSGDVVLPSTPLRANGVAWIDRYPTDVLTIAGFDGSAPAQIDVRGETSGSHTGFSANPYDALALDDGRILVARFGVNFDAGAPPLQRGNDVVVFDHGVLTQRLDVAADVPLGATCVDGECTAFARPAVLLPLSHGHAQRVLVVLDRMSRAFHHAADGAVVTIDPMTLAVSPPLVFGGLENCGYASVDPTDPSRAWVLCSGARFTSSGRLATEQDRRASAGIVALSMDASGGLAEVHRFAPGPTAPVPSNGLIVLGGGRALYVAWGSSDPFTPDRLVDVDGSGTARIVYTAHGAFVLGEGMIAQGGSAALVPDAQASAIICLWNGTAEGPSVVLDTMPITDCTGLPPRMIRPLR